MDRQAIRFIDMLDDDTVDEDGTPRISIEMKFKLFDKGEAWLTKRQKLRPTKEAQEGDGIRDMREWISNPETRGQLEEAIFDLGFVKVPEKHNGRPRTEERPVRERFKAYKEAAKAEADADDDSGWKALLRPRAEEPAE